MNYLIWFLIYLYGGSMLVAIVTFFAQAPFWLIGLNFTSVLSLFATPFHPYLLYFGLTSLLLAAYLNGRLILGKNTLSHLLVRLLISLVLIFLYHLFIK